MDEKGDILSSMAGFLFWVLEERSAHGLIVFFMNSSRGQADCSRLFFSEKPIMNIVLIGYRCSGKTSVGRIVAENAEMSFLDTDLLIERESGRSIAEIVSGDGWEYFRKLEKSVVKEASDLDSCVISAGGGVVMDEDNIRNLKKNGFVVWLKGDIKVLAERMEKDRQSGQERPSLTGENPVQEIKKILDLRNPLYKRAADYAIDTSCRSLKEIAKLVINRTRHIIA